MNRPLSTSLKSVLGNNSGWTIGILIGLIVWGIYLAIGATGIFVQQTLLDPRKSGIVLFFVGLFLALWFVVLKGRQAKTLLNEAALREDVSGDALPVKRGWSLTGVTSLVLVLTGMCLWAIAVVTWKVASPYTTTVLGWASAILMCVSASVGMVALAARGRRRGKWLGLLGLSLCAGAFVVFLARMTP